VVKNDQNSNVYKKKNEKFWEELTVYVRLPLHARRRKLKKKLEGYRDRQQGDLISLQTKIRAVEKRTDSKMIS
jgi:hypothetical protein